MKNRASTVIVSAEDDGNSKSGILSFGRRLRRRPIDFALAGHSFTARRVARGLPAALPRRPAALN